MLFQGQPIGIAEAGDGAGELFFRPQDVTLVDAPDALFGKVTACRRLAGTRIAEIDIANDATHPITSRWRCRCMRRSSSAAKHASVRHAGRFSANRRFCAPR